MSALSWISTGDGENKSRLERSTFWFVGSVLAQSLSARTVPSVQVFVNSVATIMASCVGEPKTETFCFFDSLSSSVLRFIDERLLTSCAFQLMVS